MPRANLSMLMPDPSVWIFDFQVDASSYSSFSQPHPRRQCLGLFLPLQSVFAPSFLVWSVWPFTWHPPFLGPPFWHGLPTLFIKSWLIILLWRSHQLFGLLFSFFLFGQLRFLILLLSISQRHLCFSHDPNVVVSPRILKKSFRAPPRFNARYSS